MYSSLEQWISSHLSMVPYKTLNTIPAPRFLPGNAIDSIVTLFEAAKDCLPGFQRRGLMSSSSKVSLKKSSTCKADSGYYQKFGTEPAGL